MKKMRNRFILLSMTGFAIFWVVCFHRGFRIASPLREEIEKDMGTLPADGNSEITHSCHPKGNYDQMDPCLISFVKANLLLPPPPKAAVRKLVPYKYDVKTKAIKDKVEFIGKHLLKNNSRPGFFIECGAANGSFISPTLPLEWEYNWTGVLIEAYPSLFKDLMGMKRNAWAINVALCTTTDSDEVRFYIGTRVPWTAGLQQIKEHSKEINVPCVPLYTILAALNVSIVDYFSLDIEGTELAVLRTVPYDKIVFKVLTVEHAHVPGFQKAVVEFMETKGYKFIGTFLDHYTVTSCTCQVCMTRRIPIVSHDIVCS